GWGSPLPSRADRRLSYWPTPAPRRVLLPESRGQRAASARQGTYDRSGIGHRHHPAKGGADRRERRAILVRPRRPPVRQNSTRIRREPWYSLVVVVRPSHSSAHGLSRT